jgi:hypothetical protein
MPFKNKEKQEEYFRQYRRREEVKEKDRIRNKFRKEYLKERDKKRYLENKEQLKEYKKQYYLENKDNISEQAKKHYIENKECIKKRVKKYRLNNPDKLKDAALKRKFGITLDEYNVLLSKQKHRCAICKSFDVGRKDAKYFHVDHDHRTGKVRGLLCSKCNTALGLFNENVTLLKKAIKYLDNKKEN